MRIDTTKTVNELITALSYVIDIERKKNLYHSWRVSILSAHIAQNKVNSRELKNIFYAALLHDIGGLGLPLHIIHYLSRSDKMSQNVLLSHPIIGAQFVSSIPHMSEAAKLILDHHEWVDGQGYPRAKTKDKIPWGAQVLRMADAIDIALQTKHVCTLKELKSTLSFHINKEYSRSLFDATFGVLKKDRFFYNITNASNLEMFFHKTREDVGFIRIKKRIDAIGATLEVIAQAIDMKHPYTSGHSLRVSRYAMAIGLTMKLPHDEITRIKWAGLIHDIGKVSVLRKILDKPGALNPKEYHEVKKHVVITKDIMQMIPTLQEITPMAAAHHEYFDGSGYPLGLKGTHIPLGARILSVCDAFDAMISNRPYREPSTPKEACREIEKLSGRQFDPEIVRIATPLFRNLGL